MFQKQAVKSYRVVDSEQKLLRTEEMGIYSVQAWGTLFRFKSVEEELLYDCLRKIS